ncbi:MAG: transporter ATP-binding protein [Symbiobacteriaceae bacterium]|jgi:ABC-type multidrug transport system ATPase subunit|nr:transporter ATP-binding protein [Symbiobacteriaceae bacterium]
MTAALQLRSLSMTGSPPVRALHGLTLNVFAGEALGLLGPAGAGKSTLLRLMAGAIQPDAGQVVTAGLPPVLLDEPLSDADSPDGRRLREQVARWTRDERRAVVLATPHAAVAHALCDRVAILSEGHLLAERPAADLAPLLVEERYRIRVRGRLEQHLSRWFDGFQLEQSATDTALTGLVPDQAALRAMLTRAFDLGLTVLDVTRLEPDLTPLYR